MQAPRCHRIIESSICLDWKGPLKATLSNPPAMGCDLPLDHTYQSLIQSELKCFQEWGIHHFSGPPSSVFYHLVIGFKIVFAGKEISHKLPCSS